MKVITTYIVNVKAVLEYMCISIAGHKGEWAELYECDGGTAYVKLAGYLYEIYFDESTIKELNINP